MEYSDLKQVRNDFLRGTFTFPDLMMVSGIKYNIRHSSSYSIGDMIKKDLKGIVVYSTSDIEGARAAELNQWLLFIWGFRHDLKMVPAEVKATSRARAQQAAMTEDEAQNPNTIGDVVQIKITNIPSSSPIRGKVDTGATISSLHADKWKVNGGQIDFICPQLSKNVITVPLTDQQAVQSPDGGTEYRPVIELNIKINDKFMNSIQFNLNDRGGMEHPILIGQNVLEKGKFLIDPRMQLESDEHDLTDDEWKQLQEDFKDIELPEDEKIMEIHKALLQANIITQIEE